MLELVWIMPVLMAVAFWVILFLGPKLPWKGAEVACLAVGASFVMSCIAAVQWVRRPAELAPHGSTGAETEEHAARFMAGVGRFVARMAEGGGHALRAPVEKSVTWYKDGPISIKVGIHVDGYAVAMLFVVCFISLMVHIFSLDYMKEDRRFTHYYAVLALFTGGMLWMVITSSTIGLLLGWEIMGLCSFLLIGHWWEDKNNTDAALKAFFTTRTGDIGLLVGISIMYFAAGRTFDMQKINEAALGGGISHLVLLVAACCLFAGVVGKSAQFPLHTWLPDAMAGPTPASALIHAATMVVAGVYLFGRLYGVFWEGFSIEAGGMNLGAWIGSITIVMAALLAFVQTDIKKVLAYSTISQLGYMVMGLAVGAWTGAIFHLFTHAFFKALLFQAAGSVSHSGSHHSFEMKTHMGGLRRCMPITFITFTAGYLALAGVPPFAGFWSKDEILLGAYKNGFGLAFAAGCVGAFLTAAYMTRAMGLIFFGKNRLTVESGVRAELVPAHAAQGVHAAHDAHAVQAVHGAHDAHDAHGDGHHEDPHESPRFILVALISLAVMSTLVGLLQWPNVIKFTKWTESSVIEETVLGAGFEHPFAWSVAGPSILLALAGIAAGVLYYRATYAKGRDLGLVRRYPICAAFYKLLKNKYYLDHLWTGVVVGAIKGPIAKGAYWVNQNILDGIVNRAGTGSVKAARFTYDVIDQKVVDGAVDGVGLSASGGGGILRLLQTGRVQNYAVLFLGAAGLAALTIILFV